MMNLSSLVCAFHQINDHFVVIKLVSAIRQYRHVYHGKRIMRWEGRALHQLVLHFNFDDVPKKTRVTSKIARMTSDDFSKTKKILLCDTLFVLQDGSEKVRIRLLRSLPMQFCLSKFILKFKIQRSIRLRQNDVNHFQALVKTTDSPSWISQLVISLLKHYVSPSMTS